MVMPTIYSDELVATICARIANGESLSTICKDSDMPCTKTVYLWLQDKPDFLELYKAAHVAKADMLAEDVVPISDELCTIIVGEDGEETKVVFDSAAVARNRLRVDARKWLAGKLAPKKYGDKLSIGGDGDAPPIAHKVDVTLTPDEAYMKMIGK